MALCGPPALLVGGSVQASLRGWGVGCETRAVCTRCAGRWMEGMESGGKSNYLVKLRTLRTSTRPFLTLLPDTLRLDIAKILAYSMAFTTGLRFTFLGVRKRWASGWSLATFSGLLLMTPSTDFLHGNYWHPLGVLRAFLLCRILICWASFCKFQ